jgi:predicted anti-sigma-YlaC factor YlaD
MRVLSCAEVRDLASDLLDGEIGDDDKEAVLAHVGSCRTCPGLYRAMVLVHAELLRASGPEEKQHRVP